MYLSGLLWQYFLLTYLSADIWLQVDSMSFLFHDWSWRGNFYCHLFPKENRNSGANSRLLNFCPGVAYNTSPHILLAKASHSSQEWCQWGEKVILLLGEVLQNTHEWMRMYNPITRTDNWKLPIIHHFKE